MNNAKVVYIAAGVDGRVHRGIRLEGALYTAERDNLDQAIEREEIDLAAALERVVQGKPLCDRCFPAGEIDEVEETQSSNTADPGRAGGNAAGFGGA